MTGGRALSWRFESGKGNLEKITAKTVNACWTVKDNVIEITDSLFKTYDT